MGLTKRLSILAAIMALLGACGGGSTGVTASPEVEAIASSNAALKYFPIASNQNWSYLHSDGHLEFIRNSQNTVTSAGPTSTFVVLNRNGRTESMQLVQTSQGIARVPGDRASALERSLGNVVVLPNDLTVGRRQNVLNKTISNGLDLTGDGVLDSLVASSDIEVIGFEALTVATGSFPKAIHLRTISEYTITSGRGPIATISTTEDDWYVEDVGLVKSAAVIRSESNTQMLGQELIRSSLVTPGNAAYFRATLSPEMKPSIGTNLTLPRVILQFDEDLDSSTLGDSFSNGAHIYTPYLYSVFAKLQLKDPRTLAIDVPLNPIKKGDLVGISLPIGLKDRQGRSVNQLFFELELIDGNFLAPRISPTGGTSTLSPQDSITITYDRPVSMIPEVFSNLLPLAGDGEISRSSQELMIVEAVNDRTFRAFPRFGSWYSDSTYQITVQPTALKYYDNIQVGVAELDPNFAGGNSITVATEKGRFGRSLSFPAASGAFTKYYTSLDGISLSAIMCGFGQTLSIGASLVPVNSAGFGIFSNATTLNSPCFGNDFSTITDDFDGDGRLDIAAISSPGELVVFFQKTPGVYVKSSVATGVGNTVKLFSGDINGDGRLDLINVDYVYVDGLTRTLVTEFFLQRSDGSFAVAQKSTVNLPVNLSPSSFIDVDNDGKADLLYLATSENNISALSYSKSLGDGSFALPSTLLTYNYRIPEGSLAPPSVKLVDLNKDGIKDALLIFSKSVVTALATPTGYVFSKQIELIANLDVHANSPILFNDLDGDGLLDFVFPASSGSGIVIVYQKSRTPGEIGRQELTRSSSNSASSQACSMSMFYVDANNDGIADVVCPGSFDLTYFPGPKFGASQTDPTLKNIVARTQKLSGRP